MASTVIRNPRQLDTVFRSLSRASLPLTLSWREGEHRTGPQNATQWLWAQQVAMQTAEAAEDVQARWKLEHGVPILRATDDEFRELYDAAIRPLPYEAKLAMMKLGFEVSRKMKKPEMMRYLDAIQAECRANGLEVVEPA